jgi:hypothetical protein
MAEMVCGIFNHFDRPQGLFRANRTEICGICIFHALLRNKNWLNFMENLLRSKQNVKDYDFREKQSKARLIYCQINFLCDDCETSHNRDIKRMSSLCLRHDSNHGIWKLVRQLFFRIFFLFWFIYWKDLKKRPKGINILRTTFPCLALFYSWFAFKSPFIPSAPLWRRVMSYRKFCLSLLCQLKLVSKPAPDIVDRWAFEIKRKSSVWVFGRSHGFT